MRYGISLRFCGSIVTSRACFDICQCYVLRQVVMVHGKGLNFQFLIHKEELKDEMKHNF